MQLSECEVVEFLTDLFNKGNGYSAINSARSALSAFLVDEHGTSIGQFPSVKRFLKGVFELRPPLPRYSHIWDANIVLNYLKNFPFEDIPLSYLTYKVAMLVALSTAQRAQTLHKLYVDNFVFHENLIIIHVDSLLKQSTPRNQKFSVYLHRYPSDRNICVMTAVEEYIRRTKVIRKDEKQLFISFCKPYHAVSKSTISRWLKLVLQEAGIDIELFKPHSTRAAACSRMKRDEVHIDSILSTAGWSNCRTFEKFYNKCILVEA